MMTPVFMERGAKSETQRDGGIGVEGVWLRVFFHCLNRPPGCLSVILPACPHPAQLVRHRQITKETFSSNSNGKCAMEKDNYFRTKEGNWICVLWCFQGILCHGMNLSSNYGRDGKEATVSRWMFWYWTRAEANDNENPKNNFDELKAFHGWVLWCGPFSGPGDNEDGEMIENFNRRKYKYLSF